MPAPIYNLDDTVYVVKSDELSIKKGIITKVMADTTNEYRIDFTYPDRGTIITEESKVFLTKNLAVIYLYNQTGFQQTTSKSSKVECGVFVPLLAGAISNPFTLYPLANGGGYGEYQIFGDFVTCSGWAYGEMDESVEGGFTIDGLPFVCEIAEGFDPDLDYISYSANIGWFEGFTYPENCTNMNAILYNGWTGFYMTWVKTSGASYQNIGVQDISGPVYVEFTVTYRIKP